VFRHPFPGPGLSINVLCSAGGLADAADFTRAQKEIAKTDLAWAFSACENGAVGSGAACSGGVSSGDKSKPAFSRIDILPVKSVGVQGDFRTYRYPAVLAFDGIFGAFPSWNELERASSKVTNASRDVNRAILLLWERAGFEGKKAEDASGLTLREGYCDKTRLDQTREADAIVLEELKASRWYAKVFQHLTINLPYAAEAGHCSIVLRPVVSEDVMTARFAHLDVAVLERIVMRIAALGFVDAIYYDITNKPPATFGWE